MKIEFSKNNILYIKRSDLFCNNLNKRCKILTNDCYKIYADAGHVSKKGSEYFSNKIQEIINILSDN